MADRWAQRDGIDVIGDVHGHCGELEALLHRMGYEDAGRGWRHPRRQAAFVGDLIDRGPRQADTVSLVRAMVDAGSALVVAGNHEFNAIAFATPTGDREGATGHLRPHTPKNVAQHQAFLDEIGFGTDDHAEVIDWFATLPCWLDLGDLRIVHACWDTDAMASLGAAPDTAPTLHPDLVAAASVRDSPAHRAIEHLLKGPEVDVSPPYLDQNGHRRDRARFAWWDRDAHRVVIPGNATTLDGDPYPHDELTTTGPRPVPPVRGDAPVVFGHYWLSPEATPAPLGPAAICVDHSAGRGGPLVACRWSPDDAVDAAAFVASR